MFTPRLTKPESGNKYYNTPAAGGYAVGAILGSPRDAGCNTLANCVGYAAGRFNEIIGAACWKYLTYPPDAENFIDYARAQGLKTGNEPKLGAILVFAKGKTWDASDGAGHVAVVEQINADGTIVTSESGYGCANPFWTSIRKNDGNWGGGTAYKCIGFVYQPADVDPGGLIKKGDKGEAVTWLQTELTEHGYLPAGQIDGDFGKITLGALCGFQLENGLDIDGICGPMTKAALSAR